jgi:hypothetical protein
MNQNLKIALAAVPFILSVACTNPDRLPAETAIKAADAAAATITAEVAKYAPEQVKAFRDGLDAAKAAAGKQDWKGARAAAEGLAAKAGEAVAVAQAKLEGAKKELEDASAQLGTRIAALQARVAELSKLKKLPAGVTKDALAAAKTGVAELEAAATKARGEAGEDLTFAKVALVELLGKATELAASLKME